MTNGMESRGAAVAPSPVSAVQQGANECAKGGKGDARVWLARISVAGAMCCSCGKAAVGWPEGVNAAPECAPCIRASAVKAESIASVGGKAADEWRFAAAAAWSQLSEWYGAAAGLPADDGGAA